MPVISAFYGLVVMMYFLDDERHHLLHIHVRYQDEAANDLPRRLGWSRHGLKSVAKN
jgi:hypothetical protein